MLYIGELSSTHLVLTMMLSILLAQQDYGQTELSPEVAAQLSEISTRMYIVGIIFYIISSFLCWKIFEKCNVENAWFAWIPILVNYANFQAGDIQNPLLWTILTFIPCVNIIAMFQLITAWINIYKKLGNSPFLLLFFLSIGVYFLLIVYMMSQLFAVMTSSSY